LILYEKGNRRLNTLTETHTKNKEHVKEKEHINTNNMNTTKEITDWYVNTYPKKFTKDWEYEKFRDEIAPVLVADSTLKEKVVNEMKGVNKDTTTPAILWIQNQLLQPNNFENGTPF
jgi:carbamoylphosphate synthase small subunit